MESTRHFLPFKFIDKQNESFDPIASANVFTDADNSCYPTGTTSTSKKDLQRIEKLNLSLKKAPHYHCFSVFSPKI